MVEKVSKKAANQWAGRTDSNKWVIFDKEDTQIRDMVTVKITNTAGISLQGHLVAQAEAA